MSLKRVVKEKVGILSTFVKNKFSNHRLIPSIRAPILFLHGEKDQVVPVEHSKQMFDLATASVGREIHIGETMTHCRFKPIGDIIEPGHHFFEQNGLIPKRNKNTRINKQTFFSEKK